MSVRFLITKARALFTTHRAFFIIFLLGVLTRAWALARAGEFGWDELFSFTFSQLPWLDNLGYWLAETNPPFHMILLKIWFLILPATTLTARILSQLFGVLSLIIFYLFALKTTSKKTAHLALIFFAVAYNLNTASILARGYALLLCLSLLSNYLFLQIYYFKNTNRRLIIFYALAQFLLLFTHYTGVYNLLGQFAFLAITARKDYGNYIKHHLIPISVWLLWIIPSLSLKITADTFGAAWFMRLDNVSWLTQLNRATAMLFPHAPNIILDCTLIIVFIIGGVLLLKKTASKPNQINWFNYIYLTIIFSFLALGQWWHVKFVFALLPYFFIVVAEIINLIPWKKIKIILTLIIIFLNLYQLTIKPIADNWQKTTQFISNHTTISTEQIIISNNIVDKLSVDYFYHGPLTAKFYTDYPGENAYQKIVQQNYTFYAHPDWQLKNWYRTNKLEDFKEIFLIQQNEAGVDINKILEQDGWQLKQTFIIDPLPKKYLYWYAHN